MEPRSDILDAARIAEHAGTGWDVEVVAETGSTNADLLARCADEPCPGAVLVTEHQVAGRGRHGRVWTSPPGGHLAMSLALDASHRGAMDRLGWIPLAMGVAVAQAVADVTGVRAGVKWPNDVMVDVVDTTTGEPVGRKVAGILAELAPGARPCVVVGVGINTGLAEDELPVPTATSLNLVSGEPVDRSHLAGAVVAALADRLQDWPHATARIAERYRPLCTTLGRRVRVDLPGDRSITGTAVDIDVDGRVVVRSADGETAVAAGDVTHLRVQDDPPRA
ncbi:biotin--[acetyl-CoA-carboxylase] ligase [Williamsia deligens]|uniref:biotin--[biotin carboxyl-carrier protein] ligase n=1 Tax=Williamsia deligens TaxID=321325 RepID=A0ABW3G9Z3_9NOCA|nr:biotin--[acetyl-CoA-carboxylase] ligase [Williamsia deligens]